jgi:hypothetical protein
VDAFQRLQCSIDHHTRVQLENRCGDSSRKPSRPGAEDREAQSQQVIHSTAAKVSPETPCQFPSCQISASDNFLVKP